MNHEQQKNLDEAVKSLSETMFNAWTYFHLLQGLHQGANDHPAALRRFGGFFESTWRVTFEGLFAKVGTLLDATRATQSLPGLVTMIRRYGNAESRKLLPGIETALGAKTGPISKIKAWRHEIVAHRTSSVSSDSFYASNTMKLGEVEEALVQIESLLNSLSVGAIGVYVETRTGSAALSREGVELLRLIAASSSNEPPTKLGGMPA